MLLPIGTLGLVASCQLSVKESNDHLYTIERKNSMCVNYTRVPGFIYKFLDVYYFAELEWVSGVFAVDKIN
jgi:hypothetical protein